MVFTSADVDAKGLLYAENEEKDTPGNLEAGQVEPQDVNDAGIEYQKEIHQPPGNCNRVNACRWISSGACPFVIAAKIGTLNRGSRIMKSVANE